jgi:ankyrin repeat protein
LPAVRWLVEEVNVEVDVANKDRRTALQWACKTGRAETCSYLLTSAGADPTLRMKDDSTAFDWAVLSGDTATMELLANHPKVDIHALNKFGCAAVQWAAAAGKVDTLRWLKDRGLSLGHVNAANHGAIVKAAWKGHKDALHWLLLAPDGPQLVEQLDLLDLEGRSVAELVRQNSQFEVADWLQGLIRERTATRGKSA